MLMPHISTQKFSRKNQHLAEDTHYNYGQSQVRYEADSGQRYCAQDRGTSPSRCHTPPPYQGSPQLCERSRSISLHHMPSQSPGAKLPLYDKSTYIFDADCIFQKYDPLSMSFLYYILPSCSYNFVVDVPDVNCTCADVVPLISTKVHYTYTPRIHII